MDDDLKKTTLLPRFADRMAYHTVVMERPPEMMADRLAANATSANAHASAGATSIGSLRTRMMNVQTVPDFHNQQRVPPPLPTHVPPSLPTHVPPPSSTHVPPRLAPLPPPHASGTWQTPPTLPARRRSELVRRGVIFGGAAIVLGICLVLPFSGDEKNSQAASIPAAVASPSLDAGAREKEPVSATDMTVAPLPAAATAAPVPTPVVSNTGERAASLTVTEERAGALLLAGRRLEALAIYRQLAISPTASPGLRAMVEVLAQKVDTP